MVSIVTRVLEFRDVGQRGESGIEMTGGVCTRQTGRLRKSCRYAMDDRKAIKERSGAQGYREDVETITHVAQTTEITETPRCQD
jgi:hypothetical protein